MTAPRADQTPTIRRTRLRSLGCEEVGGERVWDFDALMAVLAPGWVSTFGV
jgi:hypothetical protein